VEKLSKDDMLAIVAHELRSPLASVLHAVECLRELNRAGRLQTGSSLAIIERQATHMARLVDDLLDVSRADRGRLALRRECVDLRAPIDAAIEATAPFMQVRRHQLALDIIAHPVWVDADRTRLQQVVANLLLNSAEYTAPGGRIELVLEEEKSSAVLKVRDTGIGIQAEALERIFDPFTQGSDRLLRPTHEGLGIGLAVVRSVVEMHGGGVEARSAGLQMGSEFIVRLPMIPRPSGSACPGARSASCP
jgi:signal transduction histidine kinase